MINLRTITLFTFARAQRPNGDAVERTLLKMAYLLFAVCFATTIISSAQTFTTLVNFNSTNGYAPYTGLTQGTDGALYGTVSEGGANDDGTVFKINLRGSLTTLQNFDSSDGLRPYGWLVQASDGNYYGTTFDGGANGFGTVFKVTPSGTLSTLYSFCSQPNCSDGTGPYAGVIQGSDGSLYGTTLYGGVGSEGTVFKVTLSGELTTLHSFCSNGCTDGYGIYDGLVQGTDGNFYGTTFYGGVPGGYGTVFKITSSGKLTTLYSFCSQKNCPDGGGPTGVMQAADGNFYGTTENAGTGHEGTVFQMTPKGKLTTLYSFCEQTGCPDGATPNEVLIQGTDGDFYGTTIAGGASNDGTIFRITTAGALTTLHSFDGTDGSSPEPTLLQAANGTFYGTTVQGGSSNKCGDEGCGTIFSLSVDLGPFVKTQPTSGTEGAAVDILGYDLTTVTGVSFNGTAAKFIVVSGTEITTTVPSGATTGTVLVTTKSGTLDSNVAFRVTPQIKSFTPTNGPVGTSVQITGVSLTQTSEVAFGGGVETTDYKVDSDTEITATVPTGAKTGAITITTPGGTAKSATNFKVTK